MTINLTCGHCGTHMTTADMVNSHTQEVCAVIQNNAEAAKSNFESDACRILSLDQFRRMFECASLSNMSTRQ